MKLIDVTVVGEIYVDHVFSGFATWPQPGEEVFTREYMREVGGGAANTACGLSRLGRTVRLMGAVGQSDLSWFGDRLNQFGVLGDALTPSEQRTGVTVSLSTRQDRSFFTFVGANEELSSTLQNRATLDLLQQSRHVHFAMPLELQLAKLLLPALRASGCTTTLDVGFQPDWLSNQENLLAIRASDYLLPNEKEAAILCGGSGEEDYFEFAKRNGIPRAVLKLGSRGAAMLQDQQRYSVRSPDVTVVDTTGAGDAFDAGFIDALLDEAAAEECLRRACLCGGLSTSTIGALNGLPDREQIGISYEQTYSS